MSLISAENLGLSFGARDLFRGIDVSLSRGERIGLVGPNGSGKTSFLRILAGDLEPSSGSVGKARGASLSWLAQTGLPTMAPGGEGLLDTMLSVFGALRAREGRLRKMEEGLGSADPAELERYGSELEAYAREGGYEYRARVERALSGLGLSKERWPLPFASLSGGEARRAALALLILKDDDILLLDEPTNHLDAGAIAWLESELAGRDGALVVASHDRRFLDRVATSIWEIGPGGVDAYRGGYADYVRQRDERRLAYLRVFAEEKERLTRESDFVMANIANASASARAYGLLRRICTDLEIVRTWGVEALRSNAGQLSLGVGRIHVLAAGEARRRIAALTPEGRRAPRPRLALPPAPPCGDTPLRGERIVVGHGRKPLAMADRVELRRGDRLAVLGPNGCGKTSLLRALTDGGCLLEGDVRLDPRTRIGRYDQTRGRTGLGLRVIDELVEGRDLGEREARAVLGSWLFQGASAFKPVAALSGGERSRLELALLSLEGPNLLVLDEPTNDLDLDSREALQDCLRAWDGTVIFVSHDRWFVDAVATRALEFRDGEIVERAL